MTSEAEEEALAFDRMQMEAVCGLGGVECSLAAELAVGRKVGKTVVCRRDSKDGGGRQERAPIATFNFLPCPWLAPMICCTKLSLAYCQRFLGTEIMHIADAMSEDLRVASGIKKAEEIEYRQFVEPLYREALDTFFRLFAGRVERN